MSKLGNAVKAYVKVSSTWTWLTGEQSNRLNQTAEAIETSDKSTIWAKFLSGKKGATAEITVFADNTDASQAAAIAAFRSGAEVDVFIGELGTGQSPAPADGDAFKAIITGVSDDNSFGSVASRTLSITATGDVTHYPAASNS